MIKFFRRIRQQLLTQNKFSKYLLYASGEIFLVVIGILIALQINNWNENRKSKFEEATILTKLNTDLKANFIEISNIKQLTELRIKSSKIILNYFKEDKPVDDTLKYSFEILNNDDLFNNANTAYKYIENQGVNVLTNDSIRTKITSMYERHFKNITKRENQNWEILTTDLRPLLDIYFEASEPLEKFFKEEYAINTPLNLKTLRENNRFKNVIVRLQNYLLLRWHWQNNTLIELEGLIKEIEIEIAKINK